MGIGTTAAIALGAGALGAGALGYMSSREQAKAQEEALQAQRDLTEPQKQMLAAYLPVYREAILPQTRATISQLTPELRSDILGRMTSTQLPQSVLDTIGEYEDIAGRNLGTYFAGRGMLASGPAQEEYRKLQESIIQQKTAALFSEQGKARSEALQLLGMGGSAPSISVPSIQIPSAGGGGTDLGSLGMLMAQLMRNSPTAASPGTMTDISSPSHWSHGLNFPG